MHHVFFSEGWPFQESYVHTSSKTKFWRELKVLRYTRRTTHGLSIQQQKLQHKNDFFLLIWVKEHTK